MRHPVLALALAAMLVPPPLAAQPLTIGNGVAVRAEDMARLDGLDASVGSALRQLLSHGTATQIAEATATLKGAPQSVDGIDPAALTGDWSCRMTKIGGNLAAVSYPPFRCRFEVDEGLLRFEKLTGSQRTRGTVYRDGDRMVYLGSTFVQGEDPRPYADFPEKVDLTAGETLPDVGVVEVTGPGRARILFPRPYRESVLNVLTLTR